MVLKVQQKKEQLQSQQNIFRSQIFQWINFFFFLYKVYWRFFWSQNAIFSFQTWIQNLGKYIVCYLENQPDPPCFSIIDFLSDQCYLVQMIQKSCRKRQKINSCVVFKSGTFHYFWVGCCWNAAALCLVCTCSLTLTAAFNCVNTDALLTLCWLVRLTIDCMFCPHVTPQISLGYLTLCFSCFLKTFNYDFGKHAIWLSTCWLCGFLYQRWSQLQCQR